MSVPQALAGTPFRTDFLSASDAARLVARVGITQVLRLISQALRPTSAAGRTSTKARAPPPIQPAA
jgi:hypothetical protein